jgi:hypothetical protein
MTSRAYLSRFRSQATRAQQQLTVSKRCVSRRICAYPFIEIDLSKEYQEEVFKISLQEFAKGARQTPTRSATEKLNLESFLNTRCKTVQTLLRQDTMQSEDRKDRWRGSAARRREDRGNFLARKLRTQQSSLL